LETGEVLVGKGKHKRFSGPNDVQYRQLNIHMLKTSISMAPWIQRYNDVQRIYKEEKHAWKAIKHTRHRGACPTNPGKLDDWVRHAVQSADEDGVPLDPEVLSLAGKAHKTKHFIKRF
jgi:hypothetical protein